MSGHRGRRKAFRSQIPRAGSVTVGRYRVTVEFECAPQDHDEIAHAIHEAACAELVRRGLVKLDRG